MLKLVNGILSLPYQTFFEIYQSLQTSTLKNRLKSKHK